MPVSGAPNGARMKTIGFIGYSNTGKTTLIEKLVPLFTARGLRVAAIKHAHHGFDMDRPGKDSYRYREAGAQQVLIATAQRWALLTETSEPATLADLLDQLAPCDLVITPGPASLRVCSLMSISALNSLPRPSRRLATLTTSPIAV